MNLYIRDNSKWINFIHDVNELKLLIEHYIPGTIIVIGDMATFNTPMKNILLKFIEENPNVDCYSSEDLADPVLLSRFVRVIKKPNSVIPISYEEFKDSPRGFLDSLAVSGSAFKRLNLYKAPDFIVNILSVL